MNKITGPKLEQYKIHILLVIAGIVVALFLFKPSFLESAMLRLDDWKYSLPVPEGDGLANQDVVVVEVDEKSINRIGRWPWDRKLIAELLHKMRQARVIGLDMVLSEKSNASSDQALAKSVAQGNVVLGYFFRDQATQHASLMENDLLDECGYNNIALDGNTVGIKEFPFVEANIPLISSGMLACGFFNMQPDTDGLYRRYSLAYLYNGTIMAPLAVQMAKYMFDQEPQLSVGRQGIIQFHLAGVELAGANDFRVIFDQPVNRVSASDILDGRIEQDFFRDKAVLLGVTELGIFDLRPTPYETTTPGVYLHYYALRDLLNNSVVQDLGRYNIVLLLLFILLVYLVSRIESTNRRYAIYLSLFVSLYLFSAFLFEAFKWWSRDSYTLLAMLGAVLGSELIKIIALRIETSKTRSALSSYISKELMKEVLQNPDRMKLGGEEKEVTILFADIRNFTSLSEKLTPTTLVELLNEIFDPLTNNILEQGGMLDKYIGDAIMAIYNAPIDRPSHAISACKSARHMVEEIGHINTRLAERGYPTIDIGIGINTGMAVVGNMGSRIRFNYTAIGDSVNLASRVEGLNKYYGTRILVSEFTAKELDDSILARRVDRIRVKGKDEAIWIYEIMDLSPEAVQLKSLYEQSLDEYQAANFSLAAEGFAGLVEQYSDKCSRLMQERCQALSGSPPEQGWDGVYRFDSK